VGRKNLSLLRTIAAVAWSFIGLRQGQEFEKDTQQLHPLALLAVGFVGAVLFVLGLMAFVNWAVKAA